MASKNQRAGAKQVQKKNFCAAKHELMPVLVVPGFKGRARMRMMCQCDGFYPMTVTSKA